MDTFTKNIIDWHLMENKRTMPWKGEKDPYKIWISEIILQQTRVLQGLSYYNNFIKEFPTLASLAAAEDDAVFKIWEGLGYYTRCKNLLVSARHIANNLNGVFPDSYEKILELKGIGPYTAAAVSSFAYGLPHAVVDGNVFRVLARYFGEALPIDSQKGKAYFTTLATQLLYKKDSSAYNQAIMDFGATVCKPQVPLCQECILQPRCVAYNHGLVNKLPVKEKQLVRKKRWFSYFIFKIGDSVLINKRTGKDIWENLFEFYLFEGEKEMHWKEEELRPWLYLQLGIKDYILKEISPFFMQQLTHQNIKGNFIELELPTLPATLKDFMLVEIQNLSNYPFPKFINQYLATATV
jgi:A/G-specific adenine glycosylase